MWSSIYVEKYAAQYIKMYVESGGIFLGQKRMELKRSKTNQPTGEDEEVTLIGMWYRLASLPPPAPRTRLTDWDTMYSAPSAAAPSYL